LAFTAAFKSADDAFMLLAEPVVAVGRAPVVVKFFISPVDVPMLLVADAL
jgi:hypothetical protein